jgi:acyl transferase domain-containing protein/NADPH:quinone reductase-like Zn-dependent oxidoreductase/aryl carrier-like protein
MLTTGNKSHGDTWRIVQEPIAIIGLGCRLPGASDDWQAYWRMLESGTDAISETPAERWNLQKFYVPNKTLPGKTQSKWGGYVRNIDMFDPQLFGISPREAASMDPQQRMLLDAAFRAIEDAGQPLERIAGQPVSVFVGISSFDYAVAGLSYQDRGVINAYSNTGGSSSIAANRISYCFDLRGPSVAVDTACSSSLVAVHMACESIWRGEAAMALAGGVNALILPDFYVAFSQLGVMSPDGRCKTFDARANGYVRSEGAAAVLLKPLSAALRDKDPIYAVIRATALNQDGRTPGMTVPSQQAQADLIRSACEKSSIAPRDIQYVEAHGTGTPVGDPIEANAIGAVIGCGRTGEDRCWVGSVKTNIGHLEAGAGMASLLKVALALHHQRIPQNLHFGQANPAIDLEALGLRIPTELVNWQSAQSRLAGINGFGYGGANAHVILEQAPQSSQSCFSTTPSRKSKPKSESEANSTPVLLPLSARNPAALQQSAQALAEWLADGGSRFHLAEIAGYYAHRRSHFDVRASVCAVDHAAMIDQLNTLVKTQVGELKNDITAAQKEKGVAFVLSGQGPQWWAMGRGLLKFSPAFRSMIKRCDAEFRKHGNWSLLTELERSESQSQMQKTAIAQPSIFAIQVALAALWESWGIKPRAIVGHSVGEIAAAYLSGALNFEDACCVAFHRGRTMDLASSQGAMVAAGLAADQVSEWIKGLETQVSIAAINGPSSVTISGAQAAIDTIIQRLESHNIFARRLAVEYAFHSPQMEPVRKELLNSLANIRPQTTHCELISTVTGGAIDGRQLGAEYWWHNVRQSVRFADAMYSLADMGYGILVEVGPHPVLTYSISECFQARGASVCSVASLNRQQSDLQCITKSLGTLYSLGLNINWSGFYNQPVRKLMVPTYPFQSQRLWNESVESALSRQVGLDHPLLGEAGDGLSRNWQQRIDLRTHEYLADHKVRGTILYPAAAFVDTALAAANCLQKQHPAPVRQIRLERLRLQNPLLLADDQPQWIQTRWDSDRRLLTMAARGCKLTPNNESRWIPLAVVTVSQQPAATPENSVQSARIQAARQRCTRAVSKSQLYDYCAKLGLVYGPSFQAVVEGVQRAGEAVLEVELPTQLDATQHCIHPALLDSCFHAMIAADHSFDAQLDGLYLPAEIREIVFHPAQATGGEDSPSQKHARLVVHARVLRKTQKKMWCDLDICTQEGAVVVSIRGFESQRVHSPSTIEQTKDLIYGNRWEVKALPPSSPSSEAPSPAHWLVLMDEGYTGRELVGRLRSRGERVTEVYRANSRVAQAAIPAAFFQICPESRDEFKQMFTQLASSPPTEVVYLWGLDAVAQATLSSQPDSALSTQLLQQSTTLTTVAPLYLVQAWDETLESATARITIVTAAAQQLEDDAALPTEVAQAPLIGLGRVVVNEYSRLRGKLVDLPASMAAVDIDSLVAELSASDDEDEIMYRGSQRWVSRFLPLASQPLSSAAAQQLPLQLRLGSSSGVEDLCYQTRARGDLTDGEVEIEVVAAGLNFSDVMKALDLYPGLTDAVVDLGAECSGRISRVGPNSRWRIGDEVIAIAPGAFGSHVTVNASLVARKPHNLTFEEAAAIPVAFLTAHYALHECAHLSKGDSVLIHAASGGVGLAAIQLALSAGVRILATAGTDEKREYVCRLGVDKVMDSRSLDFGWQTLEATAGQGVDAVLNSLPGEAITTGLSVLKTGGRFLEIGKRDIYNDAALGLYPFRNNLALFAIDLDQLFKQQAARMGQMLADLVDRFESGELRPLPVEVFSAAQTREAFRLMQQGKHIGKVVVQYRQRPCQVIAGQYDPVQLRDQATYWLAGGLGGFGLEIAKWLVARGARHLVLSGRSTVLRPQAQQAIAEMERAGASVRVLSADITQVDSIKQLLAVIDSQMPPLAGVFHTAMVLEDKLLVDLDRDTLERVLWPKVLGGWNLHQLTLDRQLDMFVLFSSLSSVFGHAGQANYSAANALLDSLAHLRRHLGLPALVINWGHLGEVGYLAEREQLGQRLERQGVLSFTIKQATDCLEYALQTMSTQLSVLRMDWTLWRGLGITNRVSPRFAHLLKHSDSSGQPEMEFGNAESLRSASSEKRIRMISSMMRGKIGSLLGMSPDQVRDDRALLEMGLDSLMAVELRNWIEAHMQVNLPISILMRSHSLAGVVQQIDEMLGNAGTATGSTQPQSAASMEMEPKLNLQPTLTSEQAGKLLNSIDQMSDEQVNQLLCQVLKQQ